MTDGKHNRRIQRVIVRPISYRNALGAFLRIHPISLYSLYISAIQAVGLTRIIDYDYDTR